MINLQRIIREWTGRQLTEKEIIFAKENKHIPIVNYAISYEENNLNSRFFQPQNIPSKYQVSTQYANINNKFIIDMQPYVYIEDTKWEKTPFREIKEYNFKGLLTKRIIQLSKFCKIITYDPPGKFFGKSERKILPIEDLVEMSYKGNTR